MVTSNCADLGYRAEAVEAALQAGLQNQPHPERLPPNIYGTDGDWETWSTPSRDARLKTAFRNLRDTAERFLALWRGRAIRAGSTGAAATWPPNCSPPMMRRQPLATSVTSAATASLCVSAMKRRASACSACPSILLIASNGAGARRPRKLATCRDSAVKRAWYEAEQRLRNQTERTYEAEMDFSLRDLRAGAGGITSPSDTDARAVLLRLSGAQRPR